MIRVARSVLRVTSSKLKGWGIKYGENRAKQHYCQSKIQNLKSKIEGLPHSNFRIQKFPLPTFVICPLLLAIHFRFPNFEFASPSHLLNFSFSFFPTSAFPLPNSTICHPTIDPRQPGLWLRRFPFEVRFYCPGSADERPSTVQFFLLPADELKTASSYSGRTGDLQ